MKRVIVALLLVIQAGFCWAGTLPAEQFFDQKMGDLKAELANAKKDGKQGVLLMYEKEDCPFCHRMKMTVLNRSEVQDYYHQHFLIFTIDVDGGVELADFKGKATTEKAFSLANRARATPAFVFYDLSGVEMTRFTGAAKDAEEFMALGRYVVDGAYKSDSFAKYKQQAR